MFIPGRSDDEIALDVARELARHQGLIGTTITPVVRAGHVTLSGTVGAWRQACDAVRAARLVKGVADVRELLVVEPPEHERMSDEELAAAAAEALDCACMSVPRGGLRVSIDGGVATLEGNVGYISQRYDAEHTVERLRGLKRVINLIRVAPQQNIDLEQARMVVTNALRGHALRDSLGIALTVSGVALRVQGELDSSQEKQDVLAAVQSIPGVREVIDELTLRCDPGSP